MTVELLRRHLTAPTPEIDELPLEAIAEDERGSITALTVRFKQ